MKKKGAVINKEKESENWCFVCKDGGDLRICDYGDCLKSYHSSCVGKDDSFLESDNYWACAWHTCFNCSSSSVFHCYTCTHGVCRRCLPDADFLKVKEKYGFCSSCLYLALLIEENKEYDSDGEKVDFRDRETCEGLFMEYYIIVKEKEGFELGNLHATRDRMISKNYSESGSEETDEEEYQISDCDSAEHLRKRRRTCNEKRSGEKKFGSLTPTKSNKSDFIGWGSRSLIEFLASIGKSTTEKLSQHDVTSIVNEYVKENKLLHPIKRKLIKCDRPLRLLFRKRTLSKHRVHELLEPHFAENYCESEKVEVEYDSDDDNQGILDARKRKGKLDIERKSVEEEPVEIVPPGCFALIAVENVKLVYLKRSLILEMLKQPETFEEKVVGCFVRVKSDRNAKASRSSYELMKVRGVRRDSVDQNNMEVILLVSAVPEEISISLLSDDDFSKEECENLRGRILAGQLERPTVGDLQQKANLLHADITKHKQKTLQNPSEVSKLLDNIPDVIPDLHALIHGSDDHENEMSSEKISSKSIQGPQTSGHSRFARTDRERARGVHDMSTLTPEELIQYQQRRARNKKNGIKSKKLKNFTGKGGGSSSAGERPTTIENVQLEGDPHPERVEIEEQEAAESPSTCKRRLERKEIVSTPREEDILDLTEKKEPQAMVTTAGAPSSHSRAILDSLTNNAHAQLKGDLQQKANLLHADITKHWIRKELALLRNLIDQANEKGWRSICASDDEAKEMSSEEVSRKSIQAPQTSEEKTSHCNASASGRKKLKSEDDIVTNSKPSTEWRNNDPRSNEGVAAENVYTSSLWYLQDPNGEHNKYHLSVLREWCKNNYCASKFKVWKEGWNEEDAVWLEEVLRAAYPKK